MEKISLNGVQFRYFILILSLFTSTWFISCLASVKLVSIFSITLTGGYLIFPFTSMFGIVLVEVYGFKNSRQAIWSGVILNSLFICLINIVNVMPAAPGWNLDAEFSKIMVPQSRILLASIISLFCSDFWNSYFMAKLKLKDQGKSLAKRIIVSSVAALLIDIVLFLFLGFYGSIPDAVLIKLIIAAYVKKIICQVLLLPLIWSLIEYLKNAEGFDIYDYSTNYNPFSFDNVYTLDAFQSRDPQRRKTSLELSGQI